MAINFDGNINFDDGIRKMSINNDPERVLTFVPNDPNLYARLASLQDKAYEIFKELEKKFNSIKDFEKFEQLDSSINDIDAMKEEIEKLNVDDKAILDYAKYYLEADRQIKNELSECFGRNNHNDFEKILGNANCFTMINNTPLIISFLQVIMNLTENKAKAKLKKEARAKVEAMKR